MKTDEIILQRLNSIEKKLNKILAPSEERYISEAEAKKRFNVSSSTLQKARYSGKLTDVTHSDSGRNFRYSVAELRSLYGLKLKTA